MEQPKQNSANKFAWIGLLLSAVGGISYFLMLDVPWIRSAAIPNTVLTVAGLVLTVAALVKRRSRVTIIAGLVSIFFSIGFLSSFYVMMKLPAAQATVAVGNDAPDFELPNQDGEPVRLSSFEGNGPVLLVFYRGHW